MINQSIKNSEGLFHLPQKWLWEIANNVCSSVRDGTHDTPKYIEQGIPLITSKNLRDDKLDFSTVKFISLEDHQQISIRSRVENGDILFAMIGTVGNPVIVNTEQEFSIKNVGLFKKNEAAINSIYLKSWLSSFILEKILERQKLLKGTTQKFIPLGSLRQLPIPLPPLNEQKRIVAKIEALQERSQRVKTELDAIKPLLDQFRQSVLAAAFRGDLTADWRENHPDVEPAEVLLERIRVERRRRWEEAELEKMKAQGKTPKDDKWKEKYQEPESVDSDNLPELPDEWCWVSFETIATIASNLVSPENYLNYPHIAPDNIEKNSGKLLEYKTIQEDKVISPKHLFYSGQILYSKIRPYLSKCVLIDFQGLCSADMYPINSDINSVYLFRYILSDIFLKLINIASGSRVVLPKANQKQVYSIPVPIPPLEEQVEIVHRIESLFKLADTIANQKSQIQNNLETLNQSILAKAFRGELVPQDLNDEPASVLLERIRQEKAKTQSTKKQTKTQKINNSNVTQLNLPGIS